MTEAVKSSTTTFMADVATANGVVDSRKKVLVAEQIEKPTQKNKAPEIKLLSEVEDERVKTVSDQVALKKAEESVNKTFEAYFNEKISFEIDDKTKKTVIKVVNSETDEVVRQFPPQEFLDMVYALNKAAQLILKDLPKYM